MFAAQRQGLLGAMPGKAGASATPVPAISATTGTSRTRGRCLVTNDRRGAMINDLWYKNAIIYCLSVGAYMDSDGDGIGDFKGLMRRLDYLHGLGVTAIWPMPFQVSPQRDDGYDVSDYYGVDPRYGTLGDFVEFTHGAKQRGIRVLIDLVINHTSNEHQMVSGGAPRPELEIPRLVYLV